MFRSVAIADDDPAKIANKKPRGLTRINIFLETT